MGSPVGSPMPDFILENLFKSEIVEEGIFKLYSILPPKVRLRTEKVKHLQNKPAVQPAGTDSSQCNCTTGQHLAGLVKIGVYFEPVERL